MADTSEQQTALDNLYADAQLQDDRAIASDCLSVHDSLAAWTTDEAGITDLSIRTTYTNIVLKLSQAVAACNNVDVIAISDLVDAADTYLHATVAAVQARGSGG